MLEAEVEVSGCPYMVSCRGGRHSCWTFRREKRQWHGEAFQQRVASLWPPESGGLRSLPVPANQSVAVKAMAAKAAH